MTRLELGIVGLFGAIIVLLGSTLWTMLDLPTRIQKDQVSDQAQLLQALVDNQNMILKKLEGK